MRVALISFFTVCILLTSACTSTKPSLKRRIYISKSGDLRRPSLARANALTAPPREAQKDAMDSLASVISRLFLSAVETTAFREKNIIATKPANVISRIKRLLAHRTPRIPIKSESSDQLLAAYDEYPGVEHGLFWWRRRWPERASYDFKVTRSLTNDSIAIIDVTVVVETRPNDNFPWQPASPNIASKRLEALIIEIRTALESP
jgi:hypothetical protein